VADATLGDVGAGPALEGRHADGNTAHGFAEQIGELEGFLAENWRAGISPTTGNPVYQRPVILTLRREDHSFLLTRSCRGPAG
jgi:hypothetical protein